MPQDVAAMLLRFTQTRTGRFAQVYRRLQIKPEISGFFNARMDQARIYYAMRTCRELLTQVSARDAYSFQEAMLYRERNRKITYKDQRDHTCHTLNNFITGWYFLENNLRLREALEGHFRKRELMHRGLHHAFGSTWIYVSLLHDIGYIFEGDFRKKPQIANHPDMVAALECLDHHFHDSFWQHNGLREDDKSVIFSDTSFQPLTIAAASIQELSSSLEHIPNLNLLSEKVAEFYCDPSIGKKISSAGDAFGLWAENYKYFGNTVMAKKIGLLRKDFEKVQTDGLWKEGPIVLDHGVCSGLVLLHFVTYHYALQCAVDGLRNAAKDYQPLLNRYDHKERGMTIDLWWSGLVWATAATAIHNRLDVIASWGQNDSHSRGRSKKSISKLSLEEDPLAYLGILVDELQFWDRFKVFDPEKDPANADTPTQSNQVHIKIDKHSKEIVISAPRHETQKLGEKLDKMLNDWEYIFRLS